MSEPTYDTNELQNIAQRFIDVANALKDEGRSLDMVNGGLMFASCIYATYSAAGNDGYLEAPGVDKVADVYRRNLARLQEMKKAQQS